MKHFLLCSAVAAALAASTAFAQDGQVYDQRQSNQQNRIANGAASGKLSAGQTAHLEHNQAKINHEVAKDAAKHGGTLTPGEKAKVHHQMNNESKDIAKDKNVTPKGPATY